MIKISINLLPPELEATKKLAKRKALVTKLSIMWLGLVVIVAALSLGLTIFQSVSIRNTDSKLKEARAKVAEFKEEESLAVVLSNRLDEIDTLIKVESNQAQAFNLISSLTPPNVKLITFTVDRSNKVLIGGESTDPKALQTFFDNLQDPAINKNSVSAIKIESMSLGTNQTIRFDLTVNLIGATKPVAAGSPVEGGVTK